jgi:hypothetical protein
MPATTATRPQLVVGIPASEFDAGDWRKDELTAFATLLGIPSRGTKAALSARIRSQLGRVHPPTTTVHTPPGDDDTIPTPATLKVVESAPTLRRGEPGSTALPSPAAVAHTQPTGFFKAAPGQSRAQALAAWFASRNAGGSGQR